MKKSETYLINFEKYSELVTPFCESEIFHHSIEAAFESLNDWSTFYTLDEVTIWFKDKREKNEMKISDIPLNEVENWNIDKETGNIYHQSGDFFVVHGIRVKTSAREVKGGWDQPILHECGNDGGLLGIIRKRFQSVPHYLFQAKTEPGNYGKVQLSPTLQATFSNLKQAHSGRKPHFSGYFENHKENINHKILFSSWLAEDGGRFYLKRNKGILLEVPENEIIELPNDNFIWLSLYQIKALLNEDAWVNPHVCGILVHV
jgi:oxidase EvaA